MDAKTDNCEEKCSLNVIIETSEPLGSLTLPDVPELKGQQIRSSARVIKKLKLDTTPLTIPEKSEKKEIVKPEDKKKCFKPLWSSDDKTLFFEALNEYGKDFESIQLYISNKFRKKGVPDHFTKTKDQIRHLYYRTWAKISKYLKFADGIKKPTQELYGLINYGELRKKMGSANEKNLLKLNKLVYKGSIILTLKSKKIRIKTPFCRALRKLNQLDDKYEEIKLPTRLTVKIRPKDMTSFLRVQSTAQNPRLKTYMPLQKRLSGLIDCLSKKWQSIEAGMYEKALISSSPVTLNCMPSGKEIKENKERLNPLLRITPPAECRIEVPSISLGEYFTRQNICFNSHLSRLGITKYKSFCNYSSYKMISKGSKRGPRPRTDSISDKSEKSPQKNTSPNEDDICDNMDTETGNEIIKEGANTVNNKDVNINSKDGNGIKDNTNNRENNNNIKENGSAKGFNAALQQEVDIVCTEEFKMQEEDKVYNIKNTLFELEKQERISAIRKGWTENDCESITFGEIYLMFGQNSKLILEYSWDPPNFTSLETENKNSIKTEIYSDNSISNSSIYPSQDLDLSDSLLKLLSVAKLHYRKNIIKCPCGHVCGTKNNAQLKRDVETKIRKILTDIDKCDETEDKNTNDEHIFDNDNGVTFTKPSVYLPPKIPINPYFQANAMHLASQIESIQRLTPRYCNRKGRRPRSKQVVVERQLPLLPNNVESGHQIVRMNIISKEDSHLPSTSSETSVESKAILYTSNIFNSQPQHSSNLTFRSEEVLNEALNGCIIDIEPSSPSSILKEDEHWINSEVGDYSLSSLLGRLESPMKTDPNLLNDDSRMSQDVDAQLRSMMTQNSIDFSASFADLAAEVAKDAKCELG